MCSQKAVARSCGSEQGCGGFLLAVYGDSKHSTSTTVSLGARRYALQSNFKRHYTRNQGFYEGSQEKITSLILKQA